MAGIPPFIGFFGKLYVLYSTISSENYFFSFIAIFVSVISSAYYLKLIKHIYTFKSFSYEADSNLDFIPFIKSYLISSLSAFIFLYFIESLPFLETTKKIVRLFACSKLLCYYSSYYI
jgi:NADH:ubiquinone oxidoreductase subunit 2 (subunit N)